MTEQYLQLLTELKQTWHKSIPVSEFMRIEPLSFDKQIFSTMAALTPNLNLHNTMFAGSIYTLATLTGWGSIWMNQKLSHAEGDIVLADAKIRYLAPINYDPIASVLWLEINFDRLKSGCKQKILLNVDVHSGDKLCAQFEGKYVSLPTQ